MKQQPSPFRNFDDLDSIVSNLKTDLTCTGDSNHSKPSDDDEMIEVPSYADNVLATRNDLDAIDEPKALFKETDDVVAPPTNLKNAGDMADRPLSNFHIEIDSIKPGDSPPRTVMKESAGLEIVLHFARDRPRDDISVIVITTSNHNSIAITDYQFDASASKV